MRFSVILCACLVAVATLELATEGAFAAAKTYSVSGQVPPPPKAQIGLMMDGGQANWIGFPAASDLDHVKSRGIHLVRIPIAWELMQGTINGPFTLSYLADLKNFLTLASTRKIKVIVELHNFAHFNTHWKKDAAANYGNWSSFANGNLPSNLALGSPAVPVSALVKFWRTLVPHLKGNPGLGGYDIMNEPVGMANNSVWPSAAQAVVKAIRALDMTTTIYVPGDNWGSAENWNFPWYNQNLRVDDPANNLVYEAHQYFDDGSGQYQHPFDPVLYPPNSGADRLKPFADWLQANNARGFIGEFGIWDAQWLPILDNFMDALLARGIDGTYALYTYQSKIIPTWRPDTEGINIAPVHNKGLDILEHIFMRSQPMITAFAQVGTTKAVTLSGWGASNNTVNVYDGTILLGKTTSDIKGFWQFRTGALSGAQHSLRAKNIDAAGNTSRASTALVLTVRTVTR